MFIFKVILVLSDVIIKQRIMRKPTFSQYYARNDALSRSPRRSAPREDKIIIAFVLVGHFTHRLVISPTFF